MMKTPTAIYFACAICFACLSPIGAFANEKFKIAVARMPGRTAADLSYNFFHTMTREKGGDVVRVDISGGVGILRWDDDRDGDGRMHVDLSSTIDSVYFLIGPFIAFGTQGPAIGLRTACGYQYRRAYIGGYWEFAAGRLYTRGAKFNGLPFARARAGIGLQAGFIF